MNGVSIFKGNKPTNKQGRRTGNHNGIGSAKLLQKTFADPQSS